MIDPVLIQRIREEVSLLELAKEHGIEFRRQGGDWFGRCPFHDEKSGSFKVNEKKNGYKCFGCGAHGDVINFYVAHRGLDGKRDFPEVLRVLGARIGLTVDGGAVKPTDKPKAKRRTREEIEADKEQARGLALAWRASLAVRLIVEQHPWGLADIWEEHRGGGDAGKLLGIFPPEDVVWCGDVQHSIAKEALAEARPAWRAEVGAHFKPAHEWLADDKPGPRICAAAFKVDGQRGQWSRALTEVAAPRFLVVEHDKVPLDEQGALLRWLREKVGLTLRAIVFTGGKSLHGWFEYPPAAQVPRLKVMLCGVQVEKTVEGRVRREWQGGMGFDGAIWNPVQPWKLPGWPHPKTGNLAELLWISPP